MSLHCTSDEPCVVTPSVQPRLVRSTVCIHPHRFLKGEGCLRVRGGVGQKRDSMGEEGGAEMFRQNAYCT